MAGSETTQGGANACVDARRRIYLQMASRSAFEHGRTGIGDNNGCTPSVRDRDLPMYLAPLETLSAFIRTCVVIELTPGPNMAYLAILSAGNGRRVGYAATLGIALGVNRRAILTAKVPRRLTKWNSAPLEGHARYDRRSRSFASAP